MQLICAEQRELGNDAVGLKPTARVFEPRQHEAHRERGKSAALVQPEMHASVADDPIAVRPGVTRDVSAEAQALIKQHRGGDIGHSQRKLKKATELDPHVSPPASIQSPACRRNKDARACTCRGLALSAGT